MAITLRDMLLEVNLITPEQFDEALRNLVIYGGKIGTSLVEMGYLDDGDLARLLSKKLAVPYVRADDLLHIPAEVIGLLSRELTLKYKVIPLKLEKKKLSLVMADPTDLRAIDDIAFMTGYVIKPLVAPELRLIQALGQYYQMEISTRFQQVIDKVAKRDQEKEGLRREAEEQERAEAEERQRLEHEEEERRRTEERQRREAEEAERHEAEERDRLEQEERDRAEAEERQRRELEEWEKRELAEWEAQRKIKEQQRRELMERAAREREERSLLERAEQERLVREDRRRREREGQERERLKKEAAERAAMEELEELDVIEEGAWVERLERYSIGEMPLKLARAENRDEIAQTLLQFLGREFDRAALFLIRGGVATGWLAVNREEAVEDFDTFNLTLERSSFLKTVAEGKSLYLGPLPDTAQNRRILEGLGGGRPETVLLIPLMILGRVVNVIYVEGGEKMLADRLGELTSLVAKVALAFEILILREKILS